MAITAAELYFFLGRRLAELRLRDGMTQAEAARRAGISVFTYKRIEQGGRITRLQTITNVAAKLGYSAADLVRLDGSSARRRGRPRKKASTRT